MSSSKLPVGPPAEGRTPSIMLEELPEQQATSSGTEIPQPEGPVTRRRPASLRAEPASSQDASHSRTPSFEGLHLPGGDGPLRIPSPHRYPGEMTDTERDALLGTQQELPRTPTTEYHERRVTPGPAPLVGDPTADQKWLTHEPSDPKKMTHEDLKQLRHVQMYNQGESRQRRTAANANRMHDQNYYQRAEQQKQNFDQRGSYYTKNIDQRDWYYTNSLQLRKRGEEQRQTHHDENAAQRQEHHDANFAQRQEHHDANFDQRQQHQDINFAQREQHHKENKKQRYIIAGIAATTATTVGIGAGVGTYALRQNVGRNDQTVQTGMPTKRFAPQEGIQNSNGQLTKRFVPRGESDPGPGFNPHGAARYVRMDNMDTSGGYPDYMATMQPDNKRPVTQPGEMGLTQEELARLGQPRDDRPHIDIEVPNGHPATGSNPAPGPNRAPASHPRPGANPAARHGPRRPAGRGTGRSKMEEVD